MTKQESLQQDEKVKRQSVKYLLMGGAGRLAQFH